MVPERRSGPAGAISSRPNKSLAQWTRPKSSEVAVGATCIEAHRFGKGPRLTFAVRRFDDADADKKPFRKARDHPTIRGLFVINTDLAPIYGSAILDIKRKGHFRHRRCLGTDTSNSTEQHSRCKTTERFKRPGNERQSRGWLVVRESRRRQRTISGL